MKNLLELVDQLETSYHSSFQKNSVLYAPGDQATMLYIILSGCVIIQHYHYDGQLITLTELTHGQTIGGNRMFSSDPIFPMTITAKSDVEVIKLSKDEVMHLCQTNHDFLELLLRDVADKSDLLSKRFKNLSFMTIEDKVQHYLKHLYTLQKRDNLELPFSKKEWAEKMGVSRTSLSRVLQKIQENGSIHVKNRTIRVIDMNYLS